MTKDNLIAKDKLPPFKKHVLVCFTGKTCPGKGSREVLGAFRAKLEARGLAGQIRVTKSGCFDLCDIGPNAIVYPDDVWYSNVQTADLDELIDSHLVGGKPVARLTTPRA